MSQPEDTARSDLDVLIIEDDADTASTLNRLLTRAGYTTIYAVTLSDGMNQAQASKPGMVLLDLSLPDGDGVSVIDELKACGVMEIIVISGTDDAERTRRCLQAGVFDFILKPAGAADVLRSLSRADGRRRQTIVTAREYPVQPKPGFGSLEGKSPASQRLTHMIKRVAKGSFASALITGQPGVLKADVAAMVHHYSERDGRSLIINCASENDDQGQRRFFGYQSTGEQQESGFTAGYLHKAHEGSLVLDDVSSLSMNVQRRLASFLENGDVLAQGLLKPVQLRCALIALLREPAEEALSCGRLHEPLFYALAKNTIAVPPLVERREDIAYFARHAVTQLNNVFSTEKSLSVEMIQQLESYYWSGNLVELKNCLLTAYRYTEAGDDIKPNTWFFVDAEDPVSELISPFVGQSFKEVEKQLILATLSAHANNKSKTAKVLGISLKTLYNRLNSYQEQADSVDSALVGTSA